MTSKEAEDKCSSALACGRSQTSSATPSIHQRITIETRVSDMCWSDSCLRAYRITFPISPTHLFSRCLGSWPHQVVYSSPRGTIMLSFEYYCESTFAHLLHFRLSEKPNYPQTPSASHFKVSLVSRSVLLFTQILSISRIRPPSTCLHGCPIPRNSETALSPSFDTSSKLILPVLLEA